MLRIDKTARQSIGTKRVNIEEHVEHLLKPKFSGSSLSCFVNQKLGHIPAWGIRFRIDVGKDSTLKGVSLTAGFDKGDSCYPDELWNCGAGVTEGLPKVIGEWLAMNGFPDQKEDPEGFVLRLAELYPELKTYIL